MHPSSGRSLAASLLLAVLAAACTTQPVPSSTPAATPSATPVIDPALGSALVLQEDAVGGFIAPTAGLTSLPLVSVYADGTVILADPDGTNRLVPALRAARLTSDGLRRILEAARSLGLAGPDHQLDGGPAADAGAARFTVGDATGWHETIVTRLGNPVGPDAAAIERLAAFAASITAEGLGSDPATIGPWSPWESTALRLLVVPHAAAGGDPTPVDWPLATDLGAFGDAVPTGAAPLNGGGGEGARCGVIRGTDLATLLPALATADPSTIWTSAGATYTVVVRPLLPDEADETSC
jgi:hypothetical protein